MRADRAGHRARRGRRAGRHALLQQAQPARADGALRGGRRRHRPAGDRSTTSPPAAWSTCPTTCWPSWRQIENVCAVKQARYEDLAPIDGLDLLAGNDDMLAAVLDMGGTGGIHVASHLVGARDAADDRRARCSAPRSTTSLRDALRGARRHHQPDPDQGGLNMVGLEVGGPAAAAGRGSTRRAAVIRTVLERHGLLAQRFERAGTLRVLPLGGLGEIGKNMTVVEYDGRIVVVDTGLMFPTPEQLGIDLVLPDFTYLRERADDIEAIVLTHGHEDHVGALPFVLRELGRDAPPDLRRPADGRDGALQARGAQAQGRAGRGRAGPASTFEAGPFDIEMVQDGALDPRRVRGGAHLRARHDARHRRLQVRPDAGGRRARRRRAAGRARPRGRCCCCAATPPTPTGPGRRRRRPASGRVLEEVFARCEGRIVVTSFASNIHRVQQVIDAAAALDRKVALVGRSMRKNVNIGRKLGHIDVPEGHAGRRPRRSRTSRTTSWS